MWSKVKDIPYQMKRHLARRLSSGDFAIFQHYRWNMNVEYCGREQMLHHEYHQDNPSNQQKL